MTQCSSCAERRKDLNAILSGLNEILTLLSDDPEGRTATEVSSQPADQPRVDILKQIVLNNELPEDENLFEKVMILITDMGYASTMVLQHRLEMSYRQAADIIVELERSGLIGAAHGFRPHKVMPCAYAIRDRLEAGSKGFLWRDEDEKTRDKDLCETR